jgi:hypothetical protein
MKDVVRVHDSNNNITTQRAVEEPKRNKTNSFNQKMFEFGKQEKNVILKTREREREKEEEGEEKSTSSGSWLSGGLMSLKMHCFTSKTVLFLYGSQQVSNSLINKRSNNKLLNISRI